MLALIECCIFALCSIRCCFWIWLSLSRLIFLLFSFCVSVVFSHTESSFASVLFLFVFNGVAL